MKVKTENERIVVQRNKITDKRKCGGNMSARCYRIVVSKYIFKKILEQMQSEEKSLK